MISKNHVVEYFAKKVHSELKKRKSASPGIAILTKLFEVPYFSSLRTEELHPIKCYIVYIDPKNPEDTPVTFFRGKDGRRYVRSFLKREARWSYIKLTPPVRLTVPSLVKLANASEPRTSSFAVYPNEEGDLDIWGMIDQMNNYYDWTNHNVDDMPEQPGLFQVACVGIGHLVAYIGSHKIAELKIDVVLDKTLDVLTNGPIYEKLKPSIQSYTNAVLSEIPKQTYEEAPDYYNQKLTNGWISLLCRLLLRIQNYRHGGAILITPNTLSSKLNIKYCIQYLRLQSALKMAEIAGILSTDAAIEIINKYHAREIYMIPVQLHFQNVVQERYWMEHRNELDGAIWFISLLTRVDGLVLMDPNLNVQGFGVEIIHSDDPEYVYRAKDSFGNLLSELDPNHFGMRHRSMMRYCSQDQESIGFVISQDGDVRVMTKVNEKLVIWDNIKLQRDLED